MNKKRSQSLLVAAAFAAIYLVWGSTYAAIRVAVEALPPLLLAAVRVAIAGGLLYAVLRARGCPRPSAAHWRTAVLLGVVMVAGGNGVVFWAELYVSSGMAALLRATVPLWLVALNGLWFARSRPGAGQLLGVAVGMTGVYLLASDGLAGGHPMAGWGAVALITSSVAWAAGSLLAPRLERPRSSFMGAAQQMLCGSVVLGAAGIARGEHRMLDLDGVGVAPLAALAYLVVFGSIVGFGAYTWLLQRVPTASVATHTFVNPVVALLLGHVALGEPLSTRMLLGAVLVVGAVALVVGMRGGWPSRVRSVAHEVAGVAARMLLQVVLVVVLGRVERRRVDDLGHDRERPAA
jgi:drug/metabolite transporter (DMT)-like permease